MWLIREWVNEGAGRVKASGSTELVRCPHASLWGPDRKMNIASREVCYAMSVELFPKADSDPHVAPIQFKTGERSSQELFPFLLSRCTNRR